MRSSRYFSAVDSHTEGMPTRVITSGLGVLPGGSMRERRLYFERNLDDLRLLLMREPRGHAAMSGAFLQPSTRPDADWGSCSSRSRAACRCADTGRSASQRCSSSAGW